MSIIKKIRSWLGYFDYPEGFHPADAPAYMDKNLHIRLSNLTESAKRLGLSTKDIKNINMKKTFKQKLKQLDNIIKEFKDKECLTDCEKEELKQLQSARDKLLRKKSNKLAKKAEKYNSMIKAKRLSDLKTVTFPDDELFTLNPSYSLSKEDYLKIESENLVRKIKECVEEYKYKVNKSIREFSINVDYAAYKGQLFNTAKTVRDNINVNYIINE